MRNFLELYAIFPPTGMGKEAKENALVKIFVLFFGMQISRTKVPINNYLKFIVDLFWEKWRGSEW